MKKKVMVLGVNGQVGKDLNIMIDREKYEVFPFSKNELDITDRNDLDKKIKDILPDWIINVAAYTNVEDAEDNFNKLNWSVNFKGIKYISELANKVNSKLIHISTDYVFDGEKTDEYLENDPTNPLNEYGKAKLSGEQAIITNMKTTKYYILRTSWVFSDHGNNFVNTVLKLAKNHQNLKFVNDQSGKPTYSKDLVECIFKIMNSEVESGIYHFSNNDECTWFEFASEIIAKSKIKNINIEKCSSIEFAQKAKRPKNSAMSLKKIENSLNYKIPNWKNALERYFS